MSDVRPRHVYRQCGRKQRYRTEHDARQMAKSAFRKRGHRLRAYLCPFCEGFHLTHALRDGDEGIE